MAGLATLLFKRLANTARAPYFIVISLVQPLAWLLLFGNLFSSVRSLPAFKGESYLTYLVPGIVVMTASIGSSFSGIDVLADLRRGLTEKLLAAPVGLGAISFAPQLQTGIVNAIQGALIMLVALAMHASPPGAPGAIGVMAVALLVGLGFSGISNTVALATGEIPAIMGIMNFLALPLNFMSTMLMVRSAMPPWMQTASRFNPVDWAVSSARVFYEGGPWSDLWWPMAGLLGFAMAGSLLSIQALRSYKHSL